MDTIRIEDFFKIIRVRFKCLAGILVLVTVLAIILNFYVIPPLYKSSTKVFIGKNNVEQEYNVGDIQAYQKLLLTYAEIIKTDDLIESALKKNNIYLNTKYVIDSIDAEPKSDTQILEISYEDTDKELAKDVLEAITNEFMSYSRELIPGETVKIVEKAKIPLSPISPKKYINVIVSSVLGLILGCGMAVLLETLDKRIRRKDQLEKITDIPVIGMIPLERKIRKEKKR